MANHEASIALHFIHYNFARIHQSLRITPAMAAGVSDHVWSIEEIVNLLDISPPGTSGFHVSTAFPELIAIDEEIRVLRLTLKSPDLSPRHRNGFIVLLGDCVKKRRKLLEGIKKRA